MQWFSTHTIHYSVVAAIGGFSPRPNEHKRKFTSHSTVQHNHRHYSLPVHMANLLSVLKFRNQHNQMLHSSKRDIAHRKSNLLFHCINELNVRKTHTRALNAFGVVFFFFALLFSKCAIRMPKSNKNHARMNALSK